MMVTSGSVVRVALLVAAVIALTLVSPSAPGGREAAKPRIKTTKSAVRALAMDGPLVAYDVGAYGSQCNKVFVWNVRTNGGTRVKAPETCEADSTSTGDGVTEIAIAGRRLAWIVTLGGNTHSADVLYTASLPKPKENRLAEAVSEGDIDGDLDGDSIGGLAGDGDLLIAGFRTSEGGRVTSDEFRRILPDGLAPFVKSTSGKPLRAVDVDGGRVAVVREKTIDIHSSRGTRVRSIAVEDANSIRFIALSGKLAATSMLESELRIYDVDLGRRVAARRVPDQIVWLDFYDGIAVYVTAGEEPRSIYAMNTASGRTVRLARVPAEYVSGLAIEPFGVVYSFSKTIVHRTLADVKATLRG